MSSVDFLAQDKVWFDKLRYDEAERRFYERMNGSSQPTQVTLHRLRVFTPPSWSTKSTWTLFMLLILEVLFFLWISSIFSGAIFVNSSYIFFSPNYIIWHVCRHKKIDIEFVRFGPGQIDFKSRCSLSTLCIKAMWWDEEGEGKCTRLK